MEGTLRALHDCQLDLLESSCSYTCLHIVIIRPVPQVNQFELHMMQEGAYVVHTFAHDEPFRGHPFCYHCQSAQLRFLMGTYGNLIQQWSNAEYNFRDLYTVNLYSFGQLMIRSTTQFPGNRVNRTAPRASATLVRTIETHVWKRQHYPGVGGSRMLILGHAPFRQHLTHAEEAMKEAVDSLKPFIHLLVADIYLKFIPEEDEDAGRIRMQWTPITVNPEDQTNFGIITVLEDLTLEDILSRFSRDPDVTVYVLAPFGSRVVRTRWAGFEKETFKDLYYQVQQEIGNGALPYAAFPDGTLKYPLFQVHLAMEPPLQWRRI